MKLFSVNFINKTIQILLLFLFTINAGAALYMPIFAVFVTQHIIGATLATIGITTSLYSLTKSVFQIIIAKKLDSRAGEKDDFIMLMIGVIIGIVYSFAYLFIQHKWQLFTIEAFAGLGDACIMAAYYAIFSHHIDKGSQGFEWSLFSIGGITLSASIGGLLGGLIAEHYGFNIIFIAAGTLNIVGMFLLIALYPYIKIFRTQKTYKTIVHEKR